MKRRVIWGLGLTAAAMLAAQEPKTALSSESKPAETPTTATTQLPYPESIPSAQGEIVAEVGYPVPSAPDSMLLGQTKPNPSRSDALMAAVAAREMRLSKAKFGGVFGESFGKDRTWQIFNPLAPAAYGDGDRHLTRDLTTGRGEGLILFSIRLGGGGAKNSLAARREKGEAKLDSRSSSERPR